MTGAAGTLGGVLLEDLARRGWRTRGLRRRRPVFGAAEVTPGDLLDSLSLERALEGVDAVLHLAGLTHARSARSYRRANSEGTASLAGAARARGVERFVHVSTRAISTAGGGYSRSKLEAEQIVRRSLPNATIVRLPEVYGAGGREGVDAIIDLARAGRPIPVVGRGEDEICPAHVEDVVAATATALEPALLGGQTYTLAGQCLTVAAFARLCAEVFDSPSRIRPLPVPLLRAASVAARVLPLPLYPDQLARLTAPKAGASAGACTDLAFHPRALADGLRSLRHG